MTIPGTTARELNLRHMSYDVKKLVEILTKFCDTETGRDAGVQLISYQGHELPVREFNLREIRMVENKILGAKDRYRCLIIID